MKAWLRLLGLTVWLAGCDRAPAPPPVSAPAEPAPPKIAAPSPTPAPPSDATEENFQRATALKAEGKLAEARALLQPLAEGANTPERVLNLLGEINTQILFSPAAAPEKVDYTIVAGDSLGKLAKKYETTVELIKKANGLGGDTIRVGDRVRIYQGKFAVIVNKSANQLTVTDHGKYLKRYKVGTGQYSKTPVGEFKITSRIEHPPWWRADGRTIPFGDPENILGTHWLGLDVPRYGIHGTWETNSIGKQATAGCIRLLNSDVGELYTILPTGTPVAIHD